jgi:chitinase
VLADNIPIDVLRDPFTLPPKRILTTSFIPSAWIDDTLIAERKAGLTHYLSELLSSEYKEDPALLRFLTHSSFQSQPSAEDALPSTLTRKAALKIADELEKFASPIAAGYYESWTADSRPPEKLDYSKWDLIFFGQSVL